MTDNTATVFWALLTAIVLAFQGVASARPLRQIGILAASLLRDIVNFIVLGILGFFFYKQGQANLIGMAWFGLLGITATVMDGLFTIKPFTIGPPRLTTLMSTAPLLSLVLGVLFLAVRPGVGGFGGYCYGDFGRNFREL